MNAAAGKLTYLIFLNSGVILVVVVLLFLCMYLGMTVEDQKSVFNSVLDEREASRETQTLTFSKASAGAVATFLQNHDMIRTTEPAPNYSSQIEFPPFEWLNTEDKDMERATIYLKQQLIKFGFQIGRGNFECYDTHATTGILSFSDDKTGKLSGGTDIILAPSGLGAESYAQEACVCFEFKTYERIKKEGLNGNASQALLELIAASYHSNQLVMVVLTDMCSGAHVYTLDLSHSPPVSSNSSNSKEESGHGNKDVDIDIRGYMSISLTDMALLVVEHLRDNCTPNPTYRYHRDQREDKESVAIVKEFKRRRVSPKDVAFEHFDEMLSSTASGSHDRAVVVQQYMRSFGHESNYLSMFA